MDQTTPNQTSEPSLYIPPAPVTTHPIAAAPQIKKSKKGTILGFIIGAFLLLTGGTYAAAYFGYISLPVPVPGIANDIIAESLDAWYNSDVSETTSEFKVAIETRDPSIPSMFPAVTTSTPDTNADGLGLGEANLSSNITSLDVLPEFFSIDGAATSYVEKTAGAGNMQLSGSLKATFGGTKVNVAGEVRQLDQVLYFKVSELEGVPYLDPTKILGKWITTDIDEATSLVPTETDQDSDKIVAEAQAAAKQALTIAQEKKLFRTLKSLGKEDIGGVSTKHTVHGIAAKNVLPFFEAWVAARKKAGQEIGGADKMIAEMKKTENVTIIENFSKSLFIDLWFDGKAKRIKKMSLRFVVVPPEGAVKFKNEQFTITLTSTINSVGQKKTIEVPSPTEPLESLSDALDFSDTSSANAPLIEDARTKARDSQRKSEIAMLRTGLALYYDDQGTYPPTLASLVPTYIESIPVDPTTTVSYAYEICAGNHYLLTATLEGDGGPFYANDEGTIKQSTTPIVCGAAPAETEETDNTNSPINANLDPDDLTVDTDQDGLEDFLETLYGADPTKTDSDNDGYPDGEEVKNGYNPAGPGKLSDL